MTGIDRRLARLESLTRAGDVATLAADVGVEPGVLLADAGRVASVLTSGMSDGQALDALASEFALPVDDVRDALWAVRRDRGA